MICFYCLAAAAATAKKTVCLKISVNSYNRESEFGKWLEFETMTLCHIDTSAVIPELLGPEALAWLNEYNKRVYETLSEHLAPEVAQWLYVKCNS